MLGRSDVAFEAFARNEGTALLRLALALTVDRAAAEDAVQHAFEKSFRNRARVEDLGAYARRVVVNHVRDQWRARRGETEQLESAAPVAPDHATASVARMDLLDALHRLPDGQRSVVVLRHWLGWSCEETAEALHISQGTVKSQTSKALRSLAAVLNAHV